MILSIVLGVMALCSFQSFLDEKAPGALLLAVVLVAGAAWAAG